MSRSNVGSLNIMVGANIRQLNRGLARAASTFGGFARTIGRTARRLGMIGVAAVGAGAAIGGFVVRQNLRAMDATAKLGQQIGATTENLSALTHQAGLAGVESSALESSLQRMNRRIGLAAQGSGEAAEALRHMGVDAKELSDLGSDRQFEVMADRIANIEDAGEQAAMAFRVFGRQGQELLPMLRQGSAGIEAARKEAQRLGITFNEMEARRIEEANDAMTRLRAVITGVGRQFTIAVAPALTRGVQAVQMFVERGRELLGSFISGTVRPVFAQASRFVTENWNVIARVVAERIHAIIGLASALGTAIVDISAWAFSFFQTAGNSALGSVAHGFMSLQEGVTFAMGASEFAIRNFADVFELLGTRFALGTARISNMAHHTFTEVIPKTFWWFQDFMRNLFVDVFQFVGGVVSDLSSNVVSVITNLPGLIAGRTDWAEVWVPLSTEFERMAVGFPKIAERQVGAMERELNKTVGHLEQRVGRGFDEFMNERQRKAEGTAKSMRDMFVNLGEIDGPRIPDMRETGHHIADGFNDRAAVEREGIDLIRAGTAQAQQFAHQMTKRMQRDNLERQQLQTQKGMKSVLEGIRRDLSVQPQLAAADLTP